MKVIYSIGLSALLFGSCKKQEAEAGANVVDIVFTEPSVNDTVPSYNQVHVEGTIVGDSQMEGYTLSILNAESGDVLFTNAYDVEAKSYNFHEHWTNNLIDTTLVSVKVEVKKDKNGNKATREMNIVCLP